MEQVATRSGILFNINKSTTALDSRLHASGKSLDDKPHVCAVQLGAVGSK